MGWAPSAGRSVCGRGTQVLSPAAVPSTPRLAFPPPRAAAGFVTPRRPQAVQPAPAPPATGRDRSSARGRPAPAGPGAEHAAGAWPRRGGPGRTRATRGRDHAGAGPARAGSACGGRSVLGGRRAPWPSRCPATRPVSKSRPRPCGCGGRGPGAWGPRSPPGGGPSRRPAEPLWRPGCPCAPIRRRAEAAARARRPGIPSPAWTTGRGPPRSLRTGRPGRRARPQVLAGSRTCCGRRSPREQRPPTPSRFHTDHSPHLISLPRKAQSSLWTGVLKLDSFSPLLSPLPGQIT